MLHMILGAFMGTNVAASMGKEIIGDVFTGSFLNSEKKDEIDPMEYFTGEEHVYSKSVEGLAKKHQTEVKPPANTSATFKSQDNRFPEGYSRRVETALSNPKLLQFFKNIKNYEIKDNRTIYLGNPKYLTKEDEIRMNNRAGVNL